MNILPRAPTTVNRLRKPQSLTVRRARKLKRFLIAAFCADTLTATEVQYFFDIHPELARV